MKTPAVPVADSAADHRYPDVTPPRPRLPALLRAARPKQWVKNVLVVAAPGAAGVLTRQAIVVDVVVAFVAFCLAASGTYFLNDALDVHADRMHPKKRHRPIAAGDVAVPVAYVLAAVLLSAGVAIAFVASSELAIVIGVYVGVTIAYSTWLKHVPVVDLAAVASGFVLRAIAGGVATGVEISQWFLIVTSFGSLFIVAGKRHAEHLDMGDEAGDHRRTLEAYSLSFLRYVRSTASAVTIASYCLWSFEKGDVAAAPLWYELSIIPFVLAVLSYALRLERGAGSAPEDIILHDRTILLLGLAWAACFALGVYGA